jgi:Immunoglobulin domain
LEVYAMKSFTHRFIGAGLVSICALLFLGQPLKGQVFYDYTVWVDDGAATTVLGQTVTFSLSTPNIILGLIHNAGSPPGDTFTYHIETTTGGTATLAGNQVSFTPSAAGTGIVTYGAVDSIGVASSNAGVLTITTILPQPVITLQPRPQTIASGRSVAFNIAATGSPSPTYQWTLNGSTAIPGAAVTNDPILLIRGATSANAGLYTCTASNSVAQASASAMLSVIATATPGYLANLSGRGLVDNLPADALFGGFSISGTGAKRLLIRGMGPGLGTAGMINQDVCLSEPLLTLFDATPTQINQNAGWGGAPALAAAEASLGAFAVPANSLDSMLLVSLPQGTFNAKVNGMGSDTPNGYPGIALVEVYDADNLPLSARLTNISVRSNASSGNGALIGGFVIGGNSAETVLIRAIGPSLASVFGLSDTLSNPVLTIYDSGGNALYSNTTWGGDPKLAAAETSAGAYAIDAASKDSLLLVTLPPGGYTAQVVGANSMEGISAVEIYEVP